MKTWNCLTLVVIQLFALTSFAEGFMPSNIYQLDSRFSHHVLVVEKSTHKLFLYESNNGQPKLVKTYKIASGKIIGDKQLQGDKKTPEGIYVFQDFHSDAFLIQKYGDAGLIYGAGAFTTNYPNVMDRRGGKTGGGIWLHSTDDDSRVDKGLDSRGCVVAVDLDLKDISQYIDLQNTSMVIVQDQHFITKDTWEKNRGELLEVVTKWGDSWKNKDFDNYIAQYSEDKFHDSVRGNYRQFKQYKRAVFSRKDDPQINLKNLSILAFSDYAVVTMEQEYISPVIQDVGKKTLYLTKNENYEWKIVAEQWGRLPTRRDIAFTPSMRFFKKDENIKEN